MKKIYYIENFKNVFAIYKENFIKYIKMSMYISIINIMLGILPKLIFNFENTILTIVIGIVNLIVLIFLFYNYVRVYCAMINNTSNSVSNNEISYKESFSYAKRLVPKYIYAVLLITTILVVPATVIIILYGLIGNIFIKWAIIGIFILLSIIFYIRYSFIIYVRTLEPDTKNYITKTVSLLKNNYATFFLITITINGFLIIYTFASYVLNSFTNISTLHSVFLNVGYNIINMFLLPIIVISYVLIYHKLVAK